MPLLSSELLSLTTSYLDCSAYMKLTHVVMQDTAPVKAGNSAALNINASAGPAKTDNTVSRAQTATKFIVAMLAHRDGS